METGFDGQPQFGSQLVWHCACVDLIHRRLRKSDSRNTINLKRLLLGDGGLKVKLRVIAMASKDFSIIGREGGIYA
jgi:hypothetical protein